MSTKKTLPPKPEARIKALSLKITSSVALALDRAAAEHGRTKSDVAWMALQEWLKDAGYLK